MDGGHEQKRTSGLKRQVSNYSTTEEDQQNYGRRAEHLVCLAFLLRALSLVDVRSKKRRFDVNEGQHAATEVFSLHSFSQRFSMRVKLKPQRSELCPTFDRNLSRWDLLSLKEVILG